MTFNLLITGSPFTSLACHQALKFAQAAVVSNHQIHQVFFYQDAVLIANALIHMPSNEDNIQADWLAWSSSQQLPLNVCIAACLRRGIMDASEAKRHEKQHTGNLHAGFSLSGLGEFAVGCRNSEQTLTFGA